MSYDWNFYFAQIEQQPASILVDIGIRQTTPDIRREHLYWVLVRLNDPSPEGMTTPRESVLMGYIEDELAEKTGRIGAQFVGRVTTAGRREFYYYAPHNAAFVQATNAAMCRFQSYAYEVGDQNDPDWSHYRDFLYPDPEAQQTIDNRRVIMALQASGDDLSQPRPVRHFIHFRDVDCRGEFVNLAHSLGYTAELSHSMDRPNSLGLILERVESAQPVDIDSATLTLYRHAIEFDGMYDHWESPVIRPTAPALNFWQRLFGKKPRS